MKNIWINSTGWIGVACLIGGYVLLSFSFIDQGLLYQLLNLVGAIGLGLTAWVTRNRQSLYVQIFWGIIAISALIRLFMSS